MGISRCFPSTRILYYGSVQKSSNKRGKPFETYLCVTFDTSKQLVRLLAKFGVYGPKWSCAAQRYRWLRGGVFSDEVAKLWCNDWSLGIGFLLQPGLDVWARIRAESTTGIIFSINYSFASARTEVYADPEEQYERAFFSAWPDRSNITTLFFWWRQWGFKTGHRVKISSLSWSQQYII